MAFDAPIPGQTPIEDVSGLRDRSITTQAALNAAEAESIRRVVLRYLVDRPSRRVARFDLAWIKRLHAEMFGEVWAWAGEVRKTELNLGSPAHRVETDLQALLDDLGSWSGFGMPMLEQSARLHHGAVRVHPFLNGNGRWARMLGNIWLRVNGEAIVEWPEQVIGRESVVRGAYIEALRRADGTEFGELVELHRRFTPGRDVGCGIPLMTRPRR